MSCFLLYVSITLPKGCMVQGTRDGAMPEMAIIVLGEY